MSHKSKSSVRGWNPVADWYDGWVGQNGSKYHQELAIPALLAALQPEPGEAILDFGAGQGVLAPYIAEQGAVYTGIDISRRLVNRARQRHGRHGQFLVGDVRRAAHLRELGSGAYDAVTFLLSIQDMNPLDAVLASAAWALKPQGRAVILMTHPCFRIPRQSGWGYDPQRKLRYRRLDSYLSPLKVPMKSHRQGTTTSFHRPLAAYINGLAAHGLMIDLMREITASESVEDKSDRRAQREFPLFLVLRAMLIR